MAPDLAFLPDTPLDRSTPIAARFRDRGITMFREACCWVRDLPYGASSGAPHPDVVFDELRGTCQSKHSVIAALAREIGVAVDKYLGVYRLDESIVEHAGAVLAAHGLVYVPQLHCLLKYDCRFFDLTAGNGHGKKHDLTDMDAYFQVDPFVPGAIERDIYALAVRYYQLSDAVLALKSADELRQIARQCVTTPSRVCALT